MKMTDHDYIRKGVELADGFEIVADNLVISGFRLLPCDPNKPHQVFLDALKAQLVRQVDATPISDKRPFHRYSVIERPLSTLIYGKDGHADGVGTSNPNSRAMNSIKVVVDSKLLEPTEPPKMRFDQAVRNLSSVQERINEFNTECEEREHTDTGDAWDLLGAIDTAITDVLNSWDTATPELEWRDCEKCKGQGCHWCGHVGRLPPKI